MSSPTGRANIDIPLTPKPPTVRKLTYKHSLRIAVTVDPTPMFRQHNPLFIKGTEPDSNGAYAYVRASQLEAYGRLLGYEPHWCAANGALNQASCWYNETGFRSIPPVANRFNIDQNLEGNHSDPIDAIAAAALCALAMDARHFGADVPEILPLVLDIESTQTYHGSNTLAEKIAAYTAAFELFRSRLNEDRELYQYWFAGFNMGSYELSPELAAADEKMMRLLSGINIGAYWWDLTEQNFGSWTDAIDHYEGTIEDKYPFHKHNRWLTVYPYRQMYYGHNELNNTPIPMDGWKRMIDRAADGDWNILLWGGWEARVEPVEKHLQYLARVVN